jgi:hypothetical protein
MLEALKLLNGGIIHLPVRSKDYPDRDRLALRFERFVKTHSTVGLTQFWCSRGRFCGGRIG